MTGAGTEGPQVSHVGFEKPVHVTCVLWARDIRRQAEEMAQEITGKVWGHGWTPSSRVDKLAVVWCSVTPAPREAVTGGHWDLLASKSHLISELQGQ